jgi:hypothetical protein
MSNTAATQATVPTPSLLTAISSTSRDTIISVILCILAIGQFIYATILASQSNSQGQKWGLIAPQVTKIIIMTLLGSFALFVVSVLYYLQNPSGIVYFILAITLLTMNLAYAAYAFGAARNK